MKVIYAFDYDANLLDCDIINHWLEDFLTAKYSMAYPMYEIHELSDEKFGDDIWLIERTIQTWLNSWFTDVAEFVEFMFEHDFEKILNIINKQS